ncbi:9130_t:CDS:2 [Funneliformis caledonium]|uniref:9130_t:CDS:1 n=1 Tax=Funneliformis caledonium TaxID=1117310 RepID=A0A9N8YRG7_9GLOM|nr:9130_t:CDS:2 [Funneliformis caledonium]
MESSFLISREQPQGSVILRELNILNMETITLWIHIENQPISVKFLVKRIPSEINSTVLVDINPELCKKEPLRGVNPEVSSSIGSSCVRYPLSDSDVVVRCNLSMPWYKKRFPHNTGLCQDKKVNEEEEISNEFALNKLVAKIKPSEDNERAISLSIRVKGKKAFGDWEIGEVLKKVLHQDGSSIGDVRKFEIEDLQNPDPEITEEELKLLIDELKKKKCAFKYVPRNESTCREFISAFMTTAVKHVQSIEENIELKAEEWLDGSYGYGPTDYAVYVGSIIALVAVVKKEDFEKGAAQNIVQMRILMYGIVTNALQWYFIRWAGSPEDPTVEVSDQLQCKFDVKNMEQGDIKGIAGYITSILQQQVRGLDDESARPRISKRRRI